MPEDHQIWRSLRDLSKPGIAQDTCARLVENYNKQLQAVVQQKWIRNSLFILFRKTTSENYEQNIYNRPETDKWSILPFHLACYMNEEAE